MMNQMKFLGGLMAVNMLIILMLHVKMNDAVPEVGDLVPGLGLVGNHNARIINALAQGKDLIAHCTAKDQDYGKQTLKYGNYTEFKVGENTDSIKCGFYWDNKVRTFEIYNEKRYKQECGERCWWMIKETGACLFDMDSKAHIYCYNFHDDDKHNNKDDKGSN